MKTFKEFLAEKGHKEKSAFDALEHAEQFKLYEEFNKELLEANKKALEEKTGEEEIEALKEEVQSNLDTAISEMKEHAQLEAKIEKVNAANESLKEALKKQGETLAKQRKVEIVKGNPYSEFEQKFTEAIKGVDENSRNDVRVAFKVDEPKTFTVGNVAAGVYGAAAVPQNASDDLLFAQSYQAPGIYEAPRRTPDFVDLISNRSPIDQGMMHAVVQTTETGAAAVVDELGVKPYATLNFDLEKVGTKTIAVLWKESRKWRTNFSYLLPKVRQHMATLISERLEEEVYADIAGTTFTPQAGLTFTNPKELEAIGAVIYSQANMDFNADVVLVNPIDYARMVHSKSAADNHYDQFNNGSIRLINGNTLISGGNTINLRMSRRVAAGSFFVGDMSKIIFGLQNTVEYSQGFVNDDFERNLITNRLEIDMALMIPSVLAGAFIKDTYAVVLPQIQ